MEILKEGKKTFSFLEEEKYGCHCYMCETVFIAEFKDFHLMWEKDDDDQAVSCPVCENEILMSKCRRLRTDIDEAAFRKEWEIRKKWEKREKN